MSIDPTRPSHIGPGASTPVDSPGTPGSKPAEAPQPKGDQVEISDAGRAMANQGAGSTVPFTEARQAEVVERLDSGFYEQPEVVHEVAVRIVDSGDL